MVDIIRENRRPSIGERFSNAVGAGIQGTSQIMQQNQNTEANRVASELMGFDVSGFDPETRKALMIESFKQKGKFGRQYQQQEFLSNLMGGRSPLSSPMQESDQTSEFDPSEISLQDAITAENLGIKGIREAREDAIKRKDDLRKEERREQLDFHKESQKYDEDLSEKSRRAKNQIQTFKDIEKAIDSGNVKAGSWTNILRNFGDIGRSMSNAIMKKDEATVLSSIPQLLEGWKQVFGVRLTDADLKLLQDKLPDIGKSPEANKAILKVMKKYGDMTLLRNKIASDIKKTNKGLRPLGYSNMVEERFDEMVSPVRVVNPNTGNVIEIPAYKLSDAINAGARLADE